MKKTKISSKGQITLPSTIRQKLNINIGDTLYVKESDENSVLLILKDENRNIKEDAVEAIMATSGIWKNNTGINEKEIRILREADRARMEKYINE